MKLLPFLFPEKERLKFTQRKREIRLGYRRENINAVLTEDNDPTNQQRSILRYDDETF